MWLDKSKPIDSTIIFNHVPKAGGTSLIDFYRGLWGKDKCFRHRSRNSKNNTYSKAIATLTPEEVAGFKFLAGHFNYGHHSLINKPMLYLGVVRDPISRFISDYHFNRARGRTERKELTNSIDINEYAMRKLENKKSRMGQSTQIVYLTGQSDLEKAKKILKEEYLIACTTKQLNRCQLLLSDYYGFDLETPIQRNKFKEVPTIELSDEMKNALEDRYALDNEFIAFIENEFEDVSNRIFANE